MKQILFSMVLAVMAISLNAQSLDNPNAVWRLVEQLPEYKGGDKAFADYMQKNLTCPEEIKEVPGDYKTIVSFIVEKDGSLSHIRVSVSSGNEAFDAEALRLVENMPAWKPGKQKGTKVRVAYSIPVSYKILPPAEE